MDRESRREEYNDFLDRCSDRTNDTLREIISSNR